eukprot:360408-Pelagomonas_calceolata.AAC.2
MSCFIHASSVFKCSPTTLDAILGPFWCVLHCSRVPLSGLVFEVCSTTQDATLRPVGECSSPQRALKFESAPPFAMPHTDFAF